LVRGTSRCAARSTLFPYTTLFRSRMAKDGFKRRIAAALAVPADRDGLRRLIHECAAEAVERPALGALEAPAPASGAAERERIERSEEHTSELQSRENLVCRLLLEK